MISADDVVKAMRRLGEEQMQRRRLRPAGVPGSHAQSVHVIESIRDEVVEAAGRRVGIRAVRTALDEAVEEGRVARLHGGRNKILWSLAGDARLI